MGKKKKKKNKKKTKKKKKNLIMASKLFQKTNYRLVQWLPEKCKTKTGIWTRRGRRCFHPPAPLLFCWWARLRPWPHYKSVTSWIPQEINTCHTVQCRSWTGQRDRATFAEWKHRQKLGNLHKHWGKKTSQQQPCTLLIEEVAGRAGASNAGDTSKITCYQLLTADWLTKYSFKIYLKIIITHNI